MKITELQLEKFKSFELQKFNFKKITILAGANSAGKSTILNALATILQGSETRPFPFYFSNYGGNIHLGGYKDIVKDGNSSDKFGIGVRFENNGAETYVKGTYRYATNGHQILVDSIIIEIDEQTLEVKWNGQVKGYSVYRKISENKKTEDSKVAKAIFTSLSELFSKTNDTEKNTKIQNSIDEFLSSISKSSDNWEPVELKKASNLYSSLCSTISYKITIDSYIKSLSKLSNLTTYIGPIRPYPSRHYYISSLQEKIDSLGNNAFQILIDWYSSDKKKFNKVINGLQTLKLADSIIIGSLKDELVEINVAPYNQRHTVNLSDVGFGLSQILPVLVANAASENDSTLLINQPEVHLHPSSQAELANYFFTESKNKNFIIETHSEYLINRFRLLVAEGKIKSEDISIIYIDKGEQDPTLSEISISDNGALISAPDSFFNTYYVDSKALVFSSIGGGEIE
ncbi:AAA family ATPase [Halothiobacillus neapolitanus]|uniref:Endonuclease GajA/Old nuclease/RecF-like AAA domain-containing protein n=1 Tax=Halothiobacillus neapolitanus (strain ATCC 23641 / DSM 15147 / CIP 104769 / NCIMB 8539 / c2) TaxID=555778 RepID=D0L0Z2_HALNC|nr:AAA family ATPase [Halothiobacillus neapolitanus]ACX96365.1 conserved hypothetical protein [Halothiobacillus neapolitanus c2]TDN66680.1 AAA ATPase-like protein [Halothiobacillus neapolitanus]